LFQVLIPALLQPTGPGGLIPLAVMLLLLAAVIVLTGGSGLAPLMYPSR